MSLTPQTPDFQNGLQVAKNFWSKPEGKVGMVVLGLAALGIIGGVTLALPAILAFISVVLASTVELFALLAVLGFMLFLATNKKVHLLVRNCFQLSMRWATSLVIETDPIGILRNYIEEMKLKKQQLDTSISSVAGAKKSLETNISGKKTDIGHQKSLISQVDSQLLPLKRQLGSMDPNNQDSMELQLKIGRLELNKQGFAQKSGMEMDSVTKLSTILDQTNRIYNGLRRWSQLADYQIDTTTQKVDMLAEERKTVLASAKALGAAQSILKGDPAQLALIDQTLEYLADDTANKLGAMDDFDKYSQKYLDTMDIEKGASASDALAKIAEFEAKLKAPELTSTPITMIPDSTGTYTVPAPKQITSSSYDEVFKK